MSTPAGWYTDPYNRANLRYWDGAAWTSNTTRVKPVSPSSRGFAIASLVLALVGGFLAVTSLVTGPLAVIFGSIAISYARERGERKVMATWGLVLGALTFLFAVFRLFF